MPDFPSTTSASDTWNLKDQLVASTGSNWPTPEKDPYFNNVALLLSDNGVGGSINNTLVDSSSYNHTITRNGGVLQGSVSPFGNDWSNYFDGSGDYLSLSTSNLSTASTTLPFTVEGWVHMSAPGGCLFSSGIISQIALSIGFSASTLGYNDTTANQTGGRYVVFAYYNGSVWTQVVSSIQIPLNQWTHIACVFTGSSAKIYINGIDVTTGTISSWSTFSIATWYIGKRWDDVGVPHFTGYISNLRYIKGTALYRSNFTPSTTTLTSLTNTTLLTCQSNRFVDNSPNNFSLTINGNVTVSRFSPLTTDKPYNTNTLSGSYYFDGSGDYLSIPTTSGALDFIGDFTTEFWIFWNSMPTTGYQNIAGQGVAGQSSYGLHAGGTASNTWSAPYKLKLNVANSGDVLVGNTTLIAGEWYHMAHTRTSGVNRLFVNGILQTNTYTDSTTRGYAGNPYTIGNSSNCYITNFRYIKGTSLYTTSFAVPKAPLKAVTNTGLLLSGTNAGIYDSTGNNNIDVTGNTQVSSSQSVWSNSSIYFDGNGDNLIINANDNLRIVTGPFTIESWFNTPTLATQIIMCQDDGGSNSQSWHLNTVNTGTIRFTWFTTSSRSNFVELAGGTYTTNTWNHVAVTYDGSTLRLFLNGTLVASQNSPTFFNGNNPTRVGSFNGSTYFNGYIEDLRITRGVARYTSDFSPILPKIEAVGGTQLLLTAPNSTNWLKDNSINNFTVTASGDASYSVLKPPGKTEGGSFYFDGTGDYLSVPDSESFNFGAGDFTIECWVYQTVSTGAQYIISQATGVFSNSTFDINVNAGSLTGTVYYGSSFLATSSTTLSLNTWTHIALVRTGSTLVLYKNGIISGTANIGTTALNNSTSEVRVGGLNNATPYVFNGYISNLRVVKGTAVYTSSFNKPRISALPRQ